MTAQLDPKVPSAQRVLDGLRQTHIPALLEEYPGLEVNFVVSNGTKPKPASLGQNTLLSLFVIYGLLAVPFELVAAGAHHDSHSIWFVGAIWGSSSWTTS